MATASPTELLEQLRSDLMLLAAPAEQPVAWLTENGYPIDELMPQLDQSSFSFGERLIRHHLITDQQVTIIGNCSTGCSTWRPLVTGFGRTRLRSPTPAGTMPVTWLRKL